MTGEHAVGRVIARPFTGAPGRLRAHDRAQGLLRAAARRASYLDALQDAGVAVHAVGKVRDLFAGVGIDAHAPRRHERARRSPRRPGCWRELDAGLVFTNLVETDQVYGHRKDVAGFARALRRSTPRSAAGSGCLAPATCWS